MNEYLKRLTEARAKLWDEGKALLDLAGTEKRDLTADEDKRWSDLNADIDAKDKRIAELLEAEQREARADEARKSVEDVVRPKGQGDPPPAEDPTEKAMRSFLAGEQRSLEVAPGARRSLQEFRTLSRLTAAAGANTVPVTFYDQLMVHLIEVSGLLSAGPTLLVTDSGEQISMPKTTAHSTAALTAEAAAIGASDPAFGQVALAAYKYAVLIQVSSELVADTSVDLLGYLAMQAGRAVGNAFGAHAVAGTGSNQPGGVATQASVGKTGVAGAGGGFTTDDLIDLYFSVIGPYRNSPSAGWLMRDATLAAVRKLKDTTGQYLWQPSLVVGEPDSLLGKPVRTDPNVAAVGLGSRPVLFGDFSAYVVRQVANIRFERSDDFAFNSDLATFRCIYRADGQLVDTTGAIKAFVGNAA